MITEEQLREKLRKIQQLYEGSRTQGERDAAAAAMHRVKQALDAMGPQQEYGPRAGWWPPGARPRREPPAEPLIEMQFTFPDMWRRRLFSALCRRYGLQPFRYRGQRYTTVMVRAQKHFIDKTLWPEYTELAEALYEYIEEATERIIREEIFADATEPGESR